MSTATPPVSSREQRKYLDTDDILIRDSLCFYFKRRPYRSQSRVFRLYEAFCDKYARLATVTYIFFIIMQTVNHVFIVTGFELSIELNICN